MEQLPVRSVAAGVLLVGLVIFTGSLSYSLAQAGRPGRPATVETGAANETGATPGTTEQVAAAAPAWTAIHTVQTGETLFAISRRYGTDVATLKQANGLTEDRIRSGQRLKVPGGPIARRHTVQQGDSLWELANRYGVTLEALLSSNPQVDDPGHLQIGQELTLPANATAGDVIAATIGPSPALQGTFAWPVIADISSQFGPRDGRNHNGVDLAAQMGDPIKAARDGEVLLAGTVSGYGETVILRHSDGTQTLYGHASRLLVKAGERVRQGEVIAEVGSTGRSTGPHLHFEIIVNSKPIDPLLYLPKAPER